MRDDLSELVRVVLCCVCICRQCSFIAVLLQSVLFCLFLKLASVPAMSAAASKREPVTDSVCVDVERVYRFVYKRENVTCTRDSHRTDESSVQTEGCVMECIESYSEPRSYST